MVLWTGKWYSNVNSGFYVRGNISVDLPIELKLLNNTEIDINIVYTGIYRSGNAEVIKAQATYISGGGDEGSLGMIKLTSNNGIGSMTYKISIFSDKLKGSYNISSPVDNGEVELKMGINNNDNNGCKIL